MNPDLSSCMLRRNPGNYLLEVEICPDAKSGFCPDGIGEIRICLLDFSKKSGYERRRNPGNYLPEVEICPDAKFGKIRICLLAAAAATQGFGAFSDL